MTVVLFAGPTVGAAELESLPDAVVLPPARQGDVFRAVLRYRPVAIGLIDGVFQHVPSVWHREILAALDGGVHVFGAASMGALRAAELDRLGMRGVGRIYAAYRDGCWPGMEAPFEDDDEVAIVHAPAELGFRPLSDAMVDLRATLDAAERSGAIDRALNVALAACMKTLPFRARSFAALDEAAANYAGTDVAASIRSLRQLQKRQDAIAMLAAIADLLATSPRPFVPDFSFQWTRHWDRCVDRLRTDDPWSEAVLDELRLDPDAWLACALAARGRQAMLAETDAAPRVAAQAAYDDFRHRHGLFRADALRAWLARNALDDAGLQRLVAQQAGLAVLRSAPPRHLMLDHLRLSGRAAALYERARRKRSLGGADPLPPELHAAIDWYFAHRIRRERPARLDAFIDTLDWHDKNHFERAVLLDYRDAMSDPARDPSATL